MAARSTRKSSRMSSPLDVSWRGTPTSEINESNKRRRTTLIDHWGEDSAPAAENGDLSLPNNHTEDATQVPTESTRPSRKKRKSVKGDLNSQAEAVNGHSVTVGEAEEGVSTPSAPAPLDLQKREKRVAARSTGRNTPKKNPPRRSTSRVKKEEIESTSNGNAMSASDDQIDNSVATTASQPIDSVANIRVSLQNAMEASQHEHKDSLVGTFELIIEDIEHKPEVLQIVGPMIKNRGKDATPEQRVKYSALIKEYKKKAKNNLRQKSLSRTKDSPARVAKNVSAKSTSKAGTPKQQHNSPGIKVSKQSDIAPPNFNRTSRSPKKSKTSQVKVDQPTTNGPAKDTTVTMNGSSNEQDDSSSLSSVGLDRIEGAFTPDVDQVQVNGHAPTSQSVLAQPGESAEGSMTPKSLNNQNGPRMGAFPTLVMTKKNEAQRRQHLATPQNKKLQEEVEAKKKLLHQMFHKTFNVQESNVRNDLEASKSANKNFFAATPTGSTPASKIDNTARQPSAPTSTTMDSINILPNLDDLGPRPASVGSTEAQPAPTRLRNGATKKRPHEEMEGQIDSPAPSTPAEALIQSAPQLAPGSGSASRAGTPKQSGRPAKRQARSARIMNS